MLAIVTTKIIAFSGMIQRNFPKPDFWPASRHPSSIRVARYSGVTRAAPLIVTFSPPPASW
jgi:hypothetical protein